MGDEISRQERIRGLYEDEVKHQGTMPDVNVLKRKQILEKEFSRESPSGEPLRSTPDNPVRGTSY